MGQTVKIYIDALPYMTHGSLPGTVRKISGLPETVDSRSTYVVDVELSRTAVARLSELRSQVNGLRGRAKFVVARRSLLTHIWQTLTDKGSKIEWARGL